jgi:hypothetical protein
MNNSQLDDLLDAKSRGLSRGERGGRRPTQYPDSVALWPLLDLAREIAALLVPAHIRPAFRRELHNNLVLAAQRHRVEHALLLTDTWVPGQWVDRVNDWAEYAGQGWNEISEGDRRLVVGAAAALSLAGILAYVLHQRGRATA